MIITEQNFSYHFMPGDIKIFEDSLSENTIHAYKRHAAYRFHRILVQRDGTALISTDHLTQVTAGAVVYRGNK